MSKFNENVFNATNLTVRKREKLFRERNLDSLRERAVAKRTTSLENAQSLWETTAEQFRANGITVFFADTVSSANRFISDNMGESKLIVKGKSLTTEEMELRQVLERAGREVVETDLGEWIIQQRNELPSHFTAPAIHLSAGDVAEMINHKFGENLPPEAHALTAFARRHLREKFKCADAGIIGANAICADPATVLAVSNEGNVSLSARLPEKLFIVTGWDRIYDSIEGMEGVQRLLSGSATAQEYTSYVDFFRKPLPHQQAFLVVLDNGRKALMASEFSEGARCIRCGACLNICPVYEEVGGHTFGKVYHGGIGALLTAFTGKGRDASSIASYCLRCKTCEPSCPMGIPIADLVAQLSESYPLPFYLSLPLKILGRNMGVVSGRGQQNSGSKSASESASGSGVCSDSNSNPAPASREAVFIGCAFRNPLMKKERKEIESALSRFFPNAEILDSGCCGMPHFYKGQLSAANDRLESIRKMFNPYDRIFLPCSSGFAYLREYLGDKIQLMSVAMAETAGKIDSDIPVFYHQPCHLKTGPGTSEKADLNQVIPFSEWENENRCCGSGGTYFLQHPRISRKILSRKETGMDGKFTIVTSCPSCLLQLRRVFGKARVVHSVSFMSESAHGKERRFFTAYQAAAGEEQKGT
ncbi:MAG: 4Fe-4S dicluster domain-containing protein [Acidobacteria bacterium]|nr:4Fe-4S dicluster domain-containing protein [Acidobacteriota bacterium]